MKWSVKFLPEAQQDFKNLLGNQSRIVAKSIQRVEANPLPKSEGATEFRLIIKAVTT
ncbi:MAG: hypothetical protein SPL10_06335 [Synergistales bacterium]|nr:hypothetical protein [Synergistales bacterium]MDY6401633.1 hypothetical protein [Synergistales bacterium]MDY6404329.1 hypothetical protein [Synergistales bacterium]MDY6410657.1 hypothetical protein [Synergistales bacterium]MDY6414757.1 hypothetical protein [Synergistales bacterium]